MLKTLFRIAPISLAGLMLAGPAHAIYVANDPVNATDPTGEKILENGRVNVTVKSGVSETAAGSILSGAPSNSLGKHQAVQVSIGPPNSAGSRMVPVLGPLSPTIQLEKTATLSTDTKQSGLGAMLDTDVDIGIHLGSIEDVASSAYTLEGDFGPGGGELVIPEGVLKDPAGIGVGISIFGPGLGGAITKSSSDMSGEMELPKLPDENRADPFTVQW